MVSAFVSYLGHRLLLTSLSLIPYCSLLCYSCLVWFPAFTILIHASAPLVMTFSLSWPLFPSSFPHWMWNTETLHNLLVTRKVSYDSGELNTLVCSVVSVVSNSLQPMGCSLPGSSVHVIFQARKLEWVAMPSSRGSSWSRDRNCVSCSSFIVGRFFTLWAIREALNTTYLYGVYRYIYHTHHMLLKESAYGSTSCLSLIPQYQAQYLIYCGGSIHPCWVNLNCSGTSIKLLKNSYNWG